MNSPPSPTPTISFQVPHVLPVNPFRPGQAGPRLVVELTILRIKGPHPTRWHYLYYLVSRVSKWIDRLFHCQRPLCCVQGTTSIDGQCVIKFPPAILHEQGGICARLVLPEPGDSVSVWNSHNSPRSPN